MKFKWYIRDNWNNRIISKKDGMTENEANNLFEKLVRNSCDKGRYVMIRKESKCTPTS